MAVLVPGFTSESGGAIYKQRCYLHRLAALLLHQPDWQGRDAGGLVTVLPVLYIRSTGQPSYLSRQLPCSK